MNRRTLFGRLATVAAAATVAAHVEPAQGDAAEAAECADCVRTFTSEGFVLPDAFKSPAGEQYSKVVQRAVHERAIREGVSHEEVAITMYWSAFPTYSIEPMIETFVPGDVVTADMFNQIATMTYIDKHKYMPIPIDGDWNA